MATIEISRGYTALVDDSDYERVTAHKWNANVQKAGYVYVRAAGAQDGVAYNTLLHRFLLNAPTGMIVDHINGDTLDNRRENLRLCTKQENQCNQRSHGGSSKYKGVSWFKRDSRWMAYISSCKKRHHLGYFDSEQEAARAYDKAALTLHGSFARLNNV